ncbi:MAG TPA: glycoside hydrolase family 3 C-terminal domain-containing protein [Gemmatimonadales bacterium]|nr:glycoside hydrolase family 3 C-terminal domain-containing protein [Gemmatimonadales bacterium]
MRTLARLAPLLAFAAASACHSATGAAGSGIPAPTVGVAPASEPFRNPDLPLEARVADLVGRLTLEEKVGQMMNSAAAIPRLGIPAYDWWSEGLHGVAAAGRATVFPQAIGLAATWDTALMLRVATVIGIEARAKHNETIRRGAGASGLFQGLTFWSPNINIFRDPRWGRGMETYGEDPYLTGRMAVAFVKGMQGDDPRYLRVVSTPKHFAVHSGPDPLRHAFDAVVDARDLEETYLAAFGAAVAEGGAQSVMCAYNRVNGTPACADSLLLQQNLRARWHFDGYVVSDCDAVDDIRAGHKVAADEATAAAMALRAGDDLNCGSAYRSLVDAVHRGLIPEAEVDTALGRLIRARIRLGMFDPPDRVPYANIPYSENGSPDHRALALAATRKSIVLLKNDGTLPLRRGLGTIAVIGPNADDEETLLGNYNGLPADPVTPLAGIRAKVGTGTQVLYARGSDLAANTPSLLPIPASALVTDTGAAAKPGLTGMYFPNRTLAGAPVATRTDPQVRFDWWDVAPVPEITADSFSIRWTGWLVPPVTGRYALGVSALGLVRMYLDDSVLVQSGWPGTRSAGADLVAGTPRRIRIDFVGRQPNAMVHLIWGVPDPHLLDDAVATARRADAVVLCLGLSPRLEGEEMPVHVPGFEGGDRTSLDLPAPQEQLLEAVAATGKPVVLVLLNGSAVSVPWAAEHLPAIVEAWYPGQAAGTAIAEVLFGDYNPGGRLPVTVYRSVTQLPAFTDYRMAGRTYRFFRGDVLFPFGHGLSYTRFAYRDLRVPARLASGDTADVTVEVENAGALAGDEVVELYVTTPDTSARAPIRSLAAFQRITLAPGERRRVAFRLGPRALSAVDGAGRRAVVPGRYELSVGGKQPGMSGLADAATTEVLTARLEVVGGPVAVP